MRAPKRYQWPFICFAVLSVIHLSIYEVSDKAVGFFDLAVAVYSPISLIWLARKRLPAALTLNQLAVIGLTLFTLYAGMTLCFNWDRPMLSLLGEENYSFPVLLYVKQIEYLLIIFCTLYLARSVTTETLALSLCLSLSIVALYGFYAMFVTRVWYRLGLINMSGEVSSNPGGFVLAICLLSLFALIGKLSGFLRLYSIVSVALGYMALVFTYSRSNNVAFIICCGVLLLPRIRRHLVPITLGLVPVVILGNILFSIFSETRQLGHYGVSSFVLIANPSLILNDPSLGLRINEVWGNSYGTWSESWRTVAFGLGFGKIRITDGLYPNLLFTTGVLGLIIYMAILCVLTLRGPLVIRCIVLFVALNGVSTETTINSFRSAQVLYVYLPALLILLSRGDMALSIGRQSNVRLHNYSRS